MAAGNTYRIWLRTFPRNIYLQVKKINIITLGCSKNVVDSERIMAQLKAGGWSVSFDSDSPDFDVVVINTCGFIGDAKEESVNMILQCAAAKERGNISRLYVIGCLSERYRDVLREEIPEVDEFFGVRNLDDIVKELGLAWREEFSGERVLTTPPHYAYLKISEGCNWGCGYCAIPLIRGKHISVPMEALVLEAENLVAKGVKELMVIGQDTTYYGMDLYGERRLAELLRRLCRVDGIEWIRLHYAYPAAFPEDVISVLASEPKMCRYIDIPLQHISDRQLKAMRRGIDKQGTYALINGLRARVPDIAVRTTLLVGYPGESESDFAELAEFVREMKFERLGVFPYSEEEGTYSAENLPDDVPPEIKEERVDAIMRLQSDISYGNNQSRVGAVLKVIVDGTQGEYLVCRSQYDSPEVDQELLVSVKELERVPRPGDFVEIRITSAEEYDLYGELL